MASIWKHPKSPCWTACFTAVVGQSLVQLKKSTGTSDRKLASRIADELEDAAQGRLKAEQIQTFLEDKVTDLNVQRTVRAAFDQVLRKTVGRGLVSRTTRGFVESWLAANKGTVSKSTMDKYEKTGERFLESIGGLADQDISLVRREHIVAFRDAEASRVAATTANIALKIVRIIFAKAETDGAVTRNEARPVKLLKTTGQSARRAFTLPELKKILAVCDSEWRSLVLFGFYTGARLGDLASLTWQNIDLPTMQLTFVTRKTNRRVSIPLTEPLCDLLEKMPAGFNSRQPIHPRAFETVMREKRTGTLSRQFGELLAEAGLLSERSHQAKEKGKGRAARRQVSEISFHALRHTNVSLLKSAGVGEAVARDIVGHDSVEISRRYTHIEDSAKRKALSKLPDLAAA
ncbi:tyrosine-type recombinase/integrase [bacterium]|nr:tyrosine-type recombinase/integrase [bacterium]